MIKSGPYADNPLAPSFRPVKIQKTQEKSCGNIALNKAKYQCWFALSPTLLLELEMSRELEIGSDGIRPLG